MRFIFLLFCSLIFSNLLLGAGGRPEALLRVHVEIDQLTPKEKAVVVELQKPPKTIHVSRYAEISEQNLVGAEAYSQLPGSVMLTFNAHGKRVLNVTTSANQGKHLVCFVNGRVIYAPLIDVPLPNGKILIPSGISDQELTMLQKVAKRNAKKERNS